MNELRAIATFTKAVELGSIRQAALAQGVSPQAASQAIAQLEQQLGVRLLHRTTRSLALTEEGRSFLEHTQPALAALDRALLLARGGQDEIAGPLRIVGPRSSFAPLLMPVIREFRERHPAIVPDVQLDDNLGDWVRDRVDVGFRIGVAPDDGVIGRRLFPLQLPICASPAYLARHGVPLTLDELAAHRCSVFRHAGNGKVFPWWVQVDGQTETRMVSPALSTNDTELELQAVLCGEVIAQLGMIQAAPLIRSGQLVPLLLDHLCAPIALHLYYGTRTALPRRVRAFIDLAVERLQDSPAYLMTDAALRAAQAAALGAAAGAMARPGPPARRRRGAAQSRSA
ncbi:MAG: hypothetical protein RLY78_2261 [Pseudomonadota bacterium]